MWAHSRTLRKENVLVWQAKLHISLQLTLSSTSYFRTLSKTLQLLRRTCKCTGNESLVHQTTFTPNLSKIKNIKFYFTLSQPDLMHQRTLTGATIIGIISRNEIIKRQLSSFRKWSKILKCKRKSFLLSNIFTASWHTLRSVLNVSRSRNYLKRFIVYL